MAKCAKCGKHALFLNLPERLCKSCQTSIKSVQYNQLCSAYKIYTQISVSRKRYDAGLGLLALIEGCNSGVAEMIRKNSVANSCYLHHDVFGCLFEKDLLDELYKKIRKDLNKLSFRLEKSDEFSKEVAAIPIREIAIDTNFAVVRRALREMPEIKYSPIGKSFSFDKLPVFVVIDTETTGIKVSGGAIVEISAVLYEDLTPVSAFTSLVNPQKHIPDEATKVNGITDDMVRDAPTLDQIVPDFLDFISNAPIVGYNLPFDLKFLWTSGVDFMQKSRKYYDVLDLCRKAYKGILDSFTLENVCALNKIYRLDAHRSLSDCVATAKVLEKAVLYLQ